MDVVIVDDHRGMAEMIETTIRSTRYIRNGFIITTFSEARDRLPVIAPAIVVIDLRLGDGRGTELVRILKNKLPDTRWLLYSGYASAVSLRDAIEAGIDGAVAKRAPLATLVKAINEILAGNRFFCDLTSTELRRSAEMMALTATERRILENVAVGYEAKEIAAIIGLSHKTVLNDLVGLRRKTKANSMVELADFARCNGLA